MIAVPIQQIMVKTINNQEWIFWPKDQQSSKWKNEGMNTSCKNEWKNKLLWMQLREWSEWRNERTNSSELMNPGISECMNAHTQEWIYEWINNRINGCADEGGHNEQLVWK